MDHVHGVHLGRVAEGKPAGGCVVTLLSGKGGIGQTNVALNLGLALARRGCRTLLLDAHASPPAARLLLGSSLCTTDRALRPHGSRRPRAPAELLALGSAPVELGRAADRDAAGIENSTTLTRLRRRYDVLLVDCGSCLNRVTVALARASDLRIWLTAPEPAALAGTYAAVKSLTACGCLGRSGVVVNMARSRSDAAQTAGRLASVAQRFLGLTLELLGYVPFDAHVPAAVRQCRPLLVRFPRCPASVHIDALCDRLGPAVPGVRRRSGVWAHVASLFL